MPDRSLGEILEEVLKPRKPEYRRVIVIDKEKIEAMHKQSLEKVEYWMINVFYKNLSRSVNYCAEMN